MFCKRLAIILAAVLLMSSTAFAGILGVGTSVPGSFTYGVGSSIAKVVSEKGDLQMRVQPMGGSNIFIPSVNGGKLDFCIATDVEVALAWQGDSRLFRSPNPNLRLVSVMTPIRVGIFVKKDSPIKSIKDLKGMRVAGGFTTQKIIAMAIEAELANGGLSYEDVKVVPAANIMAAADDFASGKTDMMYFALGSAKIMQVGAKVGGVRLLSLDPSPEAWKRTNQFLPMTYPMTVKPAPHLAGVTGPSTVMAYDLMLATNADVSDDTVYAVTKALYGNKKDLVDTFKPLALFSQDKMAKKGKRVPYHPGAIKFYKEQNLWPSK